MKSVKRRWLVVAVPTMMALSPSVVQVLYRKSKGKNALRHSPDGASAAWHDFQMTKKERKTWA
jgi:hypothetical protein